MRSHIFLLLGAIAAFANPLLADEPTSNSWGWLEGCYKTVAYNGSSYTPVTPDNQVVTRFQKVTSKRFLTSDQQSVDSLRLIVGDKQNGTFAFEVVLGQKAEWVSPTRFEISYKGALYDATWKDTSEHTFQTRFEKKSEDEVALAYNHYKSSTNEWFGVVLTKVDCPRE